MTCLEELIADVATIRLLMETKKDCCDSNTTYFPTEEPTTDIMPGVGDPPEFYGETEVTDWDDWAEHVCFNAHAYVDYLVASSGQLYDAVQLSSIYLGFIAAVLALLAFSGIGLPIAFGTAAAIVAGLALGATASTFLNTPADIETARENIVCSIINGASLAAAVESALNSGTDWDLFYQFVDYDSAIAIIYEGGYETDYLPAETRDDCTCVVDSRFLFEWPANLNGWNSVPLTMLWNAGGFVTCTPSNASQWKNDRWWTWSNLATEFSFSLPVSYDQVRFRFNNHSDSGSAVRHLFRFYIYDGDDVAAMSPEYDTNDFSDDEWHEIIWNIDGVRYSGTNANEAIRMYMYRYGAVTALRRLWLDDFGVYKK
jgi:hypothetical protein